MAATMIFGGLRSATNRVKFCNLEIIIKLIKSGHLLSLDEPGKKGSFKSIPHETGPIITHTY